MSQENTTTNKKNKNSSLAAFGFVTIIIILLVSAANYLRIQAPRFQPIEHTERAEMHEAAHEGEGQTPAAEQPATKPDEHQHAH